MKSYDRRFIAIESKSFDLVCEGRKVDCLQISENGRGFYRSIYLDKYEYAWLLDALDEFWWRRKPRVWAKHLVKKNYELWFSFEKNSQGEYLALTVH